MVYNPKSDKEIKTWRISVTDDQVAVVSLKVIMAETRNSKSGSWR